jgi:hypothetical protein
MRYQIAGITSDAFQTQDLVLFDGSTLTLTMRYVPMQYGWFMTLTYGSFVINNFRLFTGGNLLRQYLEQIPFGLACFTNDLGEPTQQQDLSSGYATLFILDGDSVDAYEAFISG